MTAKFLTSAVLAAALVTGPVGPASADIGDAIAGGIIGGIIGGAIQSHNRRPRGTTVVVPSAARQLARDIQTALNHFYFHVGTPDGVLGRQSRAGISQYQAYLGFPVTGDLTEFERQVLISAHQRALVGGPEVVRVTQRHADGLRGLLGAVRDEMMGGGARTRTAGAYGLPPAVADAVDEIAASSDPSAEQLVQRAGFLQLADLNGDGRTDYILDTSVTGSAFWCNAQACTVQVFVSTPDGYARNDFQTDSATLAAFDCQRASCQLVDPAPTTTLAAAPVESVAPPATAAGMPNFFGGSRPAEASLASRCNRVGLMTTANGGLSDLGTMTDPVFTLNEQFCLARSYALADGESLMAQLGVAPQDVATQCAGIGNALQASIGALAAQPRGAVLAGVSQWMLSSGMNTADLGMNARVCLASGYATDSLPVAIGSALILTALGETAYGELPAHHLMQGVGTAQRQDLAAEWFRASVPAALTTEVAFQPGPASRNALILAAVDAATGAPAAPVPTVAPTPQPADK